MFCLKQISLVIQFTSAQVKHVQNSWKMAAFKHDAFNENVNMIEAKSDETEQHSSGNTDN